LAVIAANYAHHSTIVYLVLSILFVICLLPAFLFLYNINNSKAAKWMEYISVLWTFGMYLCLGGVPMLLNLIKK
jgi:4-hydroxybenzoate polyprenyltransferase